MPNQSPVPMPTQPQGTTPPQPQPPGPTPLPQQPRVGPIPQPMQTPAAKPQIKFPPLVWENTQSLIKQLETNLGGKVVTYYVNRGFRMVDDDVKYFYAHLRKIGHVDKLYFVISSSGGDGKAAFRIATLLKEYCGELVIVVPEIAASAATMLSLAADELMMTPLAFLTAVDTSIVHPLNPRDERNIPVSIELEEIKRAIQMLSVEQTNNFEVYKTIFGYIHPAALGAMERSKNLSEMICMDILSLPRKTPYTAEVRKQIVENLNTQYPSHGYPIPRHKAKELGMNVTYTQQETNDILWNLINTYRYMTEPARTDLADSLFHTEQVFKVIESVDSRLALNNTLERRLDPIIKGWTTLKDEIKWINYFEKEVEGVKKVMMTYLDF